MDFLGTILSVFTGSQDIDEELESIPPQFSDHNNNASNGCVIVWTYPWHFQSWGASEIEGEAYICTNTHFVHNAFHAFYSIISTITQRHLLGYLEIVFIFGTYSPFVHSLWIDNTFDLRSTVVLVVSMFFECKELGKGLVEYILWPDTSMHQLFVTEMKQHTCESLRSGGLFICDTKMT